MSKCLNRVQLLGHMGRDAEVRATQGGMTVASFSIATSYPVKDGRGGWQDKTEWTNCVAFGKRADVLQKYTGKGSKLFVEGHLQTRSWDDKETGKKRYATEVIVDDLTLLDGRRQDERQPGDDSGETYSRSSYAEQGVAEEDIPF